MHFGKSVLSRPGFLLLWSKLSMELKDARVDFLKGYFSTHDRRQKTRAAYHSDLTQFQQFAGRKTELLGVNGTLIEGWAAHLRQDEYSPASIRRKMVALRVFCSYWVRKGVLPESPFWRVKLSIGRIEQLPRTLTEKEMYSLLAQARRNHAAERKGKSIESADVAGTRYRALRNLALVDLLFATGMRVGEVSALDTADFRLQEAMFR